MQRMTGTELAAASDGLDAKVQATLELLRQSVKDYRKVVYASSLGAESIVLTDLIWTHVPQIEIFSIDTGRLHEETRSVGAPGAPLPASHEALLP
jgi:phosphoadenosine phosphosulfate reductase